MTIAKIEEERRRLISILGDKVLVRFYELKRVRPHFLGLYKRHAVNEIKLSNVRILNGAELEQVKAGVLSKPLEKIVVTDELRNDVKTK